MHSSIIKHMWIFTTLYFIRHVIEAVPIWCTYKTLLFNFFCVQPSTNARFPMLKQFKAYGWIIKNMSEFSVPDLRKHGHLSSWKLYSSVLQRKKCKVFHTLTSATLMRVCCPFKNPSLPIFPWSERADVSHSHNTICFSNETLIAARPHHPLGWTWWLISQRNGHSSLIRSDSPSQPWLTISLLIVSHARSPSPGFVKPVPVTLSECWAW